MLVSGTSTRVDVSGPFVLSRCSAGKSGGGAYATDKASLGFTDVQLMGNRAQRDGGAISAVHARSVSVTGGSVTGNNCGRGGGGVSVEATDFYGEAVNFTANVANLDGGGLRGFTETSVNITRCGFFENKALVRLGVGMNESGEDLGRFREI